MYIFRIHMCIYTEYTCILDETEVLVYSRWEQLYCEFILIDVAFVAS